MHPGSSSVRLEETFGKNDWYYHVYIWDYHRQKAAVNFFKSIPGVKTLAIAYRGQALRHRRREVHAAIRQGGRARRRHERAVPRRNAGLLADPEPRQGAESGRAVPDRLLGRQHPDRPAGGAARDQAEAARDAGRRREALRLRTGRRQRGRDRPVVLQAEDARPGGMGQEGRGEARRRGRFERGAGLCRHADADRRR